MLNQIVETIRQQVAVRKISHPLVSLPVQPGTFAFRQALAATDWALIAECKLASPSKGRLCQTHTVPELARIFTAGGAAALSVHTSTPFLGKLEDIAAVRAVSPLPILRKDFIIDEYQIYEARAAGSDAILLINAPDGSWYYSDDYRGSNPAITFANPQAGLYDIWIGSYDGSRRNPAILVFTEYNY